MSDEKQFTIKMAQLQGYGFKVVNQGGETLHRSSLDSAGD